MDYYVDYFVFGDIFIILFISFGVECFFKFWEKESGSEFVLILVYGSFIVMGEYC